MAKYLLENLETLIAKKFNFLIYDKLLHDNENDKDDIENSVERLCDQFEYELYFIIKSESLQRLNYFNKSDCFKIS